MSKLTLLLEEPLASPSALPASVKDWLTLVATWRWSSLELLTACGLAGSSGKMSPVSYPRQEDGILVPSSGRWESSGMGSPTECWTLKTSESPNVAVGSSLSDILETGEVPQQYFLSQRACAGILRRTLLRRRILPKVLLLALEKQAK